MGDALSEEDSGDDTPPYGKPLRRNDALWGDTRRASTLEQRRARERSYGMTAVTLEGEPITDTFELVEREPTKAAIAVIQRSKRDSEENAKFRDIVNLADELKRTQRVPSLLEARVRDLERDASFAKWVIRGVLGIVAAALIFVVQNVWAHAEREGRERAERDETKRLVEEIRQDLRAMRREKAIQP